MGDCGGGGGGAGCGYVDGACVGGGGGEEEGGDGEEEVWLAHCGMKERMRAMGVVLLRSGCWMKV